MEITSISAEQTQALAVDIAAQIKTGKTICLYGDLGSGKTTFVQGLAKSLGITARIVSPTFVLMRNYPIVSKNKNLRMLYHVDLYRLENAADKESLGQEELWNDQGNVVVIEWPEKIQELLPSERMGIYFEYLGENKRKIMFNDCQ